MSNPVTSQMAFGGHPRFSDSENTGSKENCITDFTQNNVHFYFMVIPSVKYFLIAAMLECSFGIQWCVNLKREQI
jgi:hypothetical protein